MVSTGHRSHTGSRSRSRSPHRLSTPSRRRQRSRSPRPSHQRHYGRSRSSTAPVRSLPCDARPLSKHDLSHFSPMLELYLDMEKNLVLEELSENEVRGRWKSFVGKWNRGELAEGWYDPTTLEKARSDGLHEGTSRSFHPRASPLYDNNGSGDDDDDEYGPALPSSTLRYAAEGSTPKYGHSRLDLQVLQVHRELAAELTQENRQRDVESMRHERRADRRLQKQRLDEIAPRAKPGSRERQLEKKREKADSNRVFAASAHDGADVELKDSELMGDTGGIDDLKRMKQAEERKRSEREVRREENLAARRAEREGRVQVMREKEEKTMGMFKELARARFGAGS